jgi:hypothetical protein
MTATDIRVAEPTPSDAAITAYLTNRERDPQNVRERKRAVYALAEMESERRHQLERAGVGVTSKSAQKPTSRRTCAELACEVVARAGQDLCANHRPSAPRRPTCTFEGCQRVPRGDATVCREHRAPPKPARPLCFHGGCTRRPTHGALCSDHRPRPWMLRERVEAPRPDVVGA